ncbi:MAG: hypothetical protein ACRDLL_15690, partial [Solirubrobacterales bacterium]
HPAVHAPAAGPRCVIVSGKLMRSMARLRLSLWLVAVAALAALGVSAAEGRTYKTCGHVTGAYGIRAYHTSCDSARSVARRANPFARPVPKCPGRWTYGLSQRTGRLSCSNPPKLVTFYATPGH